MRDSNAKRHAKCQQGERCTGPGCKAKTGKTSGKRNAPTDGLSVSLHDEGSVTFTGSETPRFATGGGF